MSSKSTMAAASDGLSGKPKDGDKATHGKLRTREMHIRKGTAGGFIARHDLEDENGDPHHKTHEFPLATMKHLQTHLQQHMAEEQAESAGGGEGQGAEMNAENNSE